MKKRKLIQYVSAFMILNILFEIISPTVALALTNGPVQQEFMGFEPASSSEMVDLFTGDFKYNIPLMDVDGYPLNLSYKAGAGMETEASWVGLGWSLNPGVLNRMMKGLPDDFNGDEVHSEVKMKPFVSEGTGTNKSWWIGTGVSISLYGVPIVNTGGDYGSGSSNVMVYNNYKGYGFEKGHDSHFSWNAGIGGWSLSKTTAHNVTYNSQEGGSFCDTYTSGIGYFGGFITTANGHGTNYNTRNGAMTNSYYSSMSVPTGVSNISKTNSTSLPAGPISYPPKIPLDITGGGESRSFRAGFWTRVGFFGLAISGGYFLGVEGFYNNLSSSAVQDVNSYGYLYQHNADAHSLMDFNRFRDGAVMEETPYASFSSSTYDLFFASAQGMNSAFRPFRSDISVVHDPIHISALTSQHKGYELGGPGIIHAVKEESDVYTNGYSKEWDNAFLNTLSPGTYTDVAVPSIANFSVSSPKAFIERTYFKELGELTERDEDFEASVLLDGPISPTMVEVGNEYIAHSPINGAGRQKRDKRSKHIECLTASQADQYGFEPRITLYDANSFAINTANKLVSASSNTALTNIDRTYKSSTAAGYTNHAVQDHISEVSLTNTSGDRYIYGIPAYNLYKKSVIFNSSSRTEGTYLTNGTSYLFPNPLFTDSPLDVSEPCQLVQYNDQDISDNNRGLDNFLKIEETPAYASSYLLTNILSSDYVDITGNGPSYDDFGSFTKFNYSREGEYRWREPYCVDAAISGTAIAGGISTATSQANYDKGLICDELDDKAEYQYGIRENYYVHSIETKNYVAVFRTSLRSDGMGVQNEQGAKGTTGESLKLDAVELYSKNEILEKGNISDAIPLKSVHFEYDYSLCQKTSNTIATDNADHGKLTLKKVYFTYGTSKKSSLSPYEFFYADNSHSSPDAQNFNYDPRSTDRWGAYKPNNGVAVGNTITLNNVEYPYAEQNKTLADSYSAAWNITEIKTPSGADINITYEADDYGYIQDQPVSQMCKIYNCANVSYTTDVVSALGSPSTCNIKNNPILIVDLSSMSNGISTLLSLSDAENYASRVLFRNKPLYFKSLLKVAGPECGAGITRDFHEFVNGYADIRNVYLFDAGIANNTYTVMNSAGTGTTSCYRFAQIFLEPSHAYNIKYSVDYIHNVTTSPMCAAGWDLLRNYVPRIAYPGSEPANMGGSLSSPVNQIENAKAGIGIAKTDLENGKLGNSNKRFFEQDFCATLYPAKSFVRVFSAHYTKLGGGHRVKKITTTDNWATVTSAINTSGYTENTSEYVQTFDYTIKDPLSGEIITSGVASYEPLTGGDENSLRQPISFEVEKTFAPNDHFFQEAPLGEMLYPAPVVGYSKVTIRTLPDPDISNVAGNGKTEFEFYTTRDFPIIDFTEEPKKETSEHIPAEATLTKFIDRLDNPKYEALKVFYMTQGNLLKFNDMHGKLKSMAVFGEDSPTTPIAKTTYLYKTKDAGSTRKLVESVPILDEQNVISTKVINRDIDVTADTRENISNTSTTGHNNLFEWGIMFVPVSFPPLIIPSPDIPTINDDRFYGSQQMGFRGATLTKVVQEYGILEKVISTYNGNTTITENLLWDANTGGVVLTRVKNNLDQPVYHYNYPAYRAYKEMAPEFKRDGIGLFCPHITSTLTLNKPLDVSTGSFSYTAVNDPVLFEAGDEVIVTDVTDPSNPIKIDGRFWFVNDPVTSTYNLVDRKGQLMTPSTYTALSTSSDYVIRLIKPINKNNLNASMGYVTSLTSPQNTLTNVIDFTLGTQKVIDAGAQEYCSGGGLYTDPLLSGQTGVNVPVGSYTQAAINPVITENYGSMRPTNSYKYKTNRDYSIQPDTKTDGLYPSAGTGSFTPFWFQEPGNPYLVSVLTSSCSRTNPGEDHGNWKVFTKHAYYSPYGDLMQVDNAINVPSSRRSGFNHTLPVLEATNARVNEVGFESFEEYAQVYPYLAPAGTNTSSIFNNDHLGFYNEISGTAGGSKPTYTTTTAHTGRYSLSYGASQSVDLKFDVQQVYRRQQATYAKTSCGCRTSSQEINAVKLDLDYHKLYIASVWVKGKAQASDYSGLVNFSVEQTYSVSSVANATTTLVKSAVINGWQKLDYEIALSSLPGSNPYTLEILISSGAGGGFYMDDFRIQPFNSTMLCKVYDPYQLRLCAELDDRNYATIYEYDNEGMLVRKKKETLNALYTIQETRTGTNKR